MNGAELISGQMKDGKGKAPPSVGCMWLGSLRFYASRENRAAIHIRKNLNPINASRAVSGTHAQGAVYFFLDKKGGSDDSAANPITTGGASVRKTNVQITS